MLASAVIAILTCVLGFVLASLRADAAIGAADLARYAWVILGQRRRNVGRAHPRQVLGRMQRRRQTAALHHDAGRARRRLLMAAISAGLLVDLPHKSVLPDMEMRELTGLKPVWLNPSNVVSDLRYYLVGFGALFLLLRWWRSADPMRTARLSLVSVFISGLMALMISDALGFPKPWLVMVAAPCRYRFNWPALGFILACAPLRTNSTERLSCTGKVYDRPVRVSTSRVRRPAPYGIRVKYLDHEASL